MSIDTAAAQLARYRSRHTIRFTVSSDYGVTRRCLHCGIRVHERHGSKLRNGYLHDADEIRRLVKVVGRG